MALPINQDCLHARNYFPVFQVKSPRLVCRTAVVAELRWQPPARPTAIKGLFTPRPTINRAKRRQYAVLFLICPSEL